MIGRFVVLVALTLSVSRPLKAEFVIRPLVVDSTSPAWLPEGWVVDTSNSIACINNSGEVAFVVVNSAAATYENALIAGRYDHLEIVAKSGDDVPGFPGVKFEHFEIPRFNNRGDILFYAVLMGDGIVSGSETPSNRDSIWLFRNGQLQLVLQAGTGSDGVFELVPYANYLLSPNGDCFMVLDHGDSQTTVTGLWRWRDGKLVRLYELGEQLPDGSNLSRFYTSSLVPLVVGDGLLVYGKNDAEKECIWWLSDQKRYPILIDGESIDLGSDGNAVAAGYLKTGIIPTIGANQSNTVALNCWTSRGPVSLKITDNHTDLMALYDSEAPDITGATFSTSSGRGMVSVLNANGQIGLVAGLMGSGITPDNEEAIWLTQNDKLNLVAREGDQVSGRSTGVVFSSFDQLPQLNSLGQMAFSAKLRGSTIDETNDEGIWYADSTGSLEPIVTEGMTLEIGNGMFRVINKQRGNGFLPRFATSASGQDGKGSPFNDRGELLFYAAWSQPEPGGGYFVASQFRVHGISVNGGNLEISVPSRSGDSYRVLTKENVSAAIWNPQNETYSGQPWNTMITLPKPSHDSFFQILKEP